ncbi:MAG: cadherin repeat domain-containing protein [Bacteroidota bacterium]
MKFYLLKKQSVFFLLLLAIPFVFINCGDDDDDIPRVVNASDFTATIVEKQAVGTVIGNVSATVPDGETATYELVNSNPSGALALSATGSLTIADATAFDFDERQSVTGTFRATAGTISDEGSIIVTLDDDGIIPLEDQRKTDGYVIVTTAPGNQSYFVDYHEELPSGTVDNSSGIDFTTFFPRQIFRGGMFLRDPNGSDNFVRMMVDGNEEIITDGPLPFVGENSFVMRVQNETTGILHDRNDPARLTIFNPSTMTVEATIDMSRGELPTDTLPQRYDEFYFRGDEVYASVRPFNGASYSSTFYHVANVSTGQYLRTVTLAQEGLFFDRNYGRSNVDDDGTLYLSSVGNVNNVPPSQARIRRILPGQNDFDPNYDFRPALVLSPTNIFSAVSQNFTLIGGGKAIARVASSVPQEAVDIVVAAGGLQNLDQAQINELLQLLFSRPTTNWCLLDLAAQTVEIIPGIPTFSYFTGMQPTLDEDVIYLPVVTEQVNEVYSYSLTDGSVEKAFEVTGGGSIYAIYHLGEE